MKTIQATAIILWGVIFVVAAFVVGQILASKDIFDVTAFVMGKIPEKEDNVSDVENVDNIANDDSINKIGQETARVGLNVAKDYFSTYYKEYVNYVMAENDIYSNNNKVTITDKEASDYVFYALARNIDNEKYTANVANGKVNISEANLNSFIDNMFEKSVTETYKKNNASGYDKTGKTYSITRENDIAEYVQELTNVENVTSNQVILIFSCKKVEKTDKKETVTEEKQIKLTAVYRGGRYIVTEVEKIKD